MHLFKTTKGIILRDHETAYQFDEDWNQLVNQRHLHDYLKQLSATAKKLNAEEFNYLVHNEILPPIGSQEVWAAGVTYLRSRNARMEESKDSGGADFYQKVYEADRPELFFKSLAHRVAGPGEQVYIRKDSTWNVPEPELTLYINSYAEIQGYTIGNDMSSRSIEGENPLYLPQAKTYERSAGLGPCLYVPEKPLSMETSIEMRITRAGSEIFKGSIRLNRMKRAFAELAGYLFRECDFITGCYLMTGTGIVPADDFTLKTGDEINISIEGIGTLKNHVATKP
jgi:2-dehydro-3-deoxy-D-arabinonate dehydratase